MNIWAENILRFVAVLSLQLLLIDHLQFLGICHPYIYLLFLLALPISISRWAELAIGFLTGAIMDMFANTPGVHIAACTAVAYCRPLLIKKIFSDSERLTGTPNGKSIGRITYLKYTSILVALHHILLFSLAAFSWHCWWITLAQIVVSSVVSLALIMGWDLLRN